ncbi:iq calmodulin-binding motif family protein [Stylonychia lemnae]|uniref:Iq calmodulin-binding motif family protein n=1 Tax=Stylonychia lemnae TaxID=5949 RepID=A0A078A6G8_STYLE|nr:iq calmodulin-binding motif family protein [Stylonychia lemnae]|eukprot:CDW77860.1 iq calmodulin-binding motif family protein [Stylonychia lemnae]
MSIKRSATQQEEFHNTDLESERLKKRIFTDLEIKKQDEERKASKSPASANRLKPQNNNQQTLLKSSLALSHQEVQELQDKGGYLQKEGIKQALFKFVQNKIKQINFAEVQERLRKEKEEQMRQEKLAQMKKFIQEQINQLNQMEKYREERIDEAVKFIENQLERKYSKNHLEWLRVSSKHEQIKPYLKQKLIEQLQNPDTEIYKQTMAKRRTLRQYSATPMSKQLTTPLSKKQTSIKRKDLKSRQNSANQSLRPQYISNLNTSPVQKLKTTVGVKEINNDLKIKLMNSDDILAMEEKKVKTKSKDKLPPDSKEILRHIQKNKSLPQFINSKQALASGGVLYNQIKNTFDKFVATCQDVLENEDTRKLLYKKGAYENERLKFSFVNPATKEAVNEILNTNQDSKSVPLMASLKTKLRNLKFDPQHQMKKDLKETFETIDQLHQQSENNFYYIFPKSNIQHYAKTPQLKKMAEKQLVNIWKEGKLDIKNYQTDHSKSQNIKGLSYDKVKEVVASLPNLNNCIDQSYLQKQINSLDVDTIQTIEAQISNDIIKKYRNDQQQVKNSRFKYLQRKASEAQEKIDQQDDIHQSQILQQEKRLNHSKTVKRFRIILNGMENGWVSKLTPNPDDPGHKLYLRRNERNNIKRSELMMPKGFNKAHYFGIFVNQRIFQADFNKAAMMIQKYYRLWKAKKIYNQQVNEREQEKLKKQQEMEERKKLSYQSFYRRSPTNIRQSFQSNANSNTNNNLTYQDGFQQPLIKPIPIETEEASPKKRKNVYIDPMIPNQREKQLNFISSVKNNNENFIKTFGQLLNKAAINARDNQKNCALYYAVRNKNLKLVKQIIAMGADVNLHCEGNNTALHEAFKVKDAKIVKLLVQKGANVLQANKKNESALYYADEEILKESGLISYKMLMIQSHYSNELVKNQAPINSSPLSRTLTIQSSKFNTNL